MKNQVLSIEQMRRLKDLGVDTSKASISVGSVIVNDPSDDICGGNQYFVSVLDHCDKDFPSFYEEYKAFTLQDIIELLPAKIQRNAEYDLTIYKDFLLYSCEGKNKCIACRPLIFFDTVDPFTDIEIGLIGAAYEMLIWVAENGYLKTK